MDSTIQFKVEYIRKPVHDNYVRRGVAPRWHDGTCMLDEYGPITSLTDAWDKIKRRIDRGWWETNDFYYRVVRVHTVKQATEPREFRREQCT